MICGRRWLMAVMLWQLAACGSEAPREFQGYVEGEFVDVAASQPGRLERLLVRRGQNVEAGTPLFVLEAQNETAARQQAEQQLGSAEALLDDLRHGKRPAELAVVRAQLAQASADAQNAAEQLRRDEAQYAAAAIARARLDDSATRAATSAARVRELRSQLDVAQLPGRVAQIGAQQAQVDAARAALAQADWRLAEKSLRASAAGRVYDTLYREGEWVAAGNPVVRMLPPQNLKLRFFVPEASFGALRIGQAVAVQCDGCAAPVAATIRYLSHEAEYTPPVIYSRDTRSKLVFMVEAVPAPADAALLHPGQPVSVRLQ